MVRLENIKKEGNCISCDLYPGNETERGYLVFDVETEEMLDYEVPCGYDCMPDYAWIPM